MMILKTVLSSFIKKSNTISRIAADVKPQNMTKAAEKIDEKPLFCHQYWDWCRQERIVRPYNYKESVSMHGQLNGINHHFINCPDPKALDKPIPFTEMTPREMVSATDIEFKCLKPTDKPMKVFRCIGKKPEFFKEYKLYEKRLKIKKGDIIDMKEYAYATSNNSYSEVYLPNGEGIKYVIDIPKGARVSRTGSSECDEVVFPRSSKFECLGTECIKDENHDYLLVKLRYLMPEF